jgi:hypothetical protein
VELARKILDWLDPLRQSDLGFPVDTGELFAENFPGVLRATLEILQQHGQVLFCEYKLR